MNRNLIKSISATLEFVVIGVALLALVYRASIYWLLPPAVDETFGLGDIIDFGLGLLLFFVSLLCAASAVGLSMTSEGQEQHLAFRPAVVGITTFVLYYFLHPYIARLI